jgi:hypothetical protein
VHSAKRVVKSGVVGAGINQVRQATLGNASKPLKPGVVDDVLMQGVRYGNKTVHGIVKNF